VEVRNKETDNRGALFRCVTFVRDKMTDEATAANLNSGHHMNEK